MVLCLAGRRHIMDTQQAVNRSSLSSQPSIISAVVGPLDYDIDAAHSSATFKVRHLMVSNVRGELGQISGRVVIDESDIARSSVDVSIDATAINTRDAKRDEHLRSADFLDVANHPVIVFKSRRVVAGKGGSLFVTGDLTIRGVTAEVTLDVDPLSAEVNDPWGNVKRGVAARARINRKDFNMVFNMALDGGGLLVGDEVAINLEVELGRKATPA